MLLLADIIKELVGTGNSLASPLLKTKVLATRTTNKTLLGWVNNELIGYASSEDLPGYRIYQGDVKGNYSNGSWNFTNQPLPTMALPKGVQSMYTTLEFMQGIESLETLKDDKAESMIYTNFSAEQIGLLQQYIQKMGNPRLQIWSAHKCVPTSTVTQILSIIRSKLLDFMLEIETTFGAEVDITTLKQQEKQIITIMHNTITNTGDGNLINTGENASITSTTKIIKNDRAGLKNALREQKVADEDIETLVAVVDDEMPDYKKPTFGAKVQHWIGNMVNKSINGTWEIGVATAGGILTEILKKYYGI